MDLIVGVDPSAKKIAWVGYVPVLNILRVEGFVLYSSGQQTVASLGLALDYVQQMAEWAKQVCPDGSWYAWIEDPLVGRGGASATMKQAFVGGVLRAALHNAGFSVQGVNVSVWKKEVCGSGRAQKPQVKQAIRAEWPKAAVLAGTDSDLADAVAINLFGQRSLRIAAKLARPSGSPGSGVQGAI